MNPRVIACHLHDYIETACVYGYQVKLSLIDGRCVQGKAVDIVTTHNHEYWLIDEGAQQQRIDLMQVSHIHVLTANAIFTELTLQPLS